MSVEITALLKPECIAAGMPVPERRRGLGAITSLLDRRRSGLESKRRVLGVLADLLAKADPGLDKTQILECLLTRECLGGSGVGQGVAFPHCRTKSGQRVVGAFLKLSQGIDFDACDHGAVDLFFAFVTPTLVASEHIHLRVLAQLAQMFSDPALREQLRNTEEVGAIYEAITTWKASE